MPRRLQRCVIHIGTEKTGTSSIQQFLAANRRKLAAEGVLYPRYTGARQGSQWGFVAAVADDVWRTGIGARLGIHSEHVRTRFAERFKSGIDEEVRRFRKGQTLLISCEHFHSRLVTRAMILKLKDLLDNWVREYQIIVYFRRQDRVAISKYSTALKTGYTNPAILHAFNTNQLPYYYNYSAIYENWAEVFGASVMRAGLFERSEFIQGDLIKDFCDKANLRLTGQLRQGRANESLSERGVEVFRRLNKHWPQAIEGSRNPVRDALVNVLSKLYNGKNYPVSRWEAEAFFNQFRDCNEKLACQAFPGRDRPLFSCNFDDYPVEQPWRN